MRRNSFVFLCFLFVVVTRVCSQQPLIGVKEGQWLLLDKGKTITLPKNYYDVGDFDQHGLAYFAVAGKYGVIDAKGNEVVAAQFNRIQSHGYGYFTTLTEDGGLLLQLKNDSIYVDSCLKWSVKDKYWMSVQKESGKFYLNLPSAKRWNLDSLYKIEQTGFGYCSLSDTSDHVTYFDHLGNAFEKEKESVVFYPDYVRVKRNLEDRIVTEAYTYLLPENVVRIEYTGAFLQYSTNTNTVRIDPMGKTILDVPFENVSPGGRDRLIVLRDFKYGLIDGSGTILIPAAYNFLAPHGEFFLAETEEGTGVIRVDGTTVVPCKYSNVRQRGALYEVETEAGLKGLYSTISGGYLLEPKFKKIAVSQDKVRGWLNTQLQIVTFDEKHQIVNQLTLDNTVSKFGGAMSQKGFDKRLFSIGWFYEKTPIFDAEGFSVGENLRWGIRDSQDSIISEPRYPTPIYVPEMDFSLIYLGKKEFNWMGMELSETMTFGGIELNKGRNMGIQFVSVDTLDGLSRDFVRFSSLEGMGYITKDNKVNKVLNIDYQDDEFVRFATSATNEIIGCEDNTPDGIQLSSYSWGAKKGPRSWSSNRKEYKMVQLPDAQWNYLTPSGTLLFNTPFEFAERFKFRTAIVKTEGKWGVINSDSLVIPAEFSRIDRMPELGDTIFRVMRSQGGLRFLDRQSNVIPLEIEKVVKMTRDYAIVMSNGKQLVINDKYEVVSTIGETYRNLTDRYFFTRIERENQIFDATGAHFATIAARPKDVFNDQLILAVDGNNFGLLDVFGDTLVPFEFTEIEALGEFIVARNRQTSWLLDVTGELLVDAGSARVLVDSITNNYAICENDKVFVYNSNGERIHKEKGIQPDVFVGNFLIELRNAGRSVNIVNDALVLPVSIKSITPVDHFGYILHTREGYEYFDKNWNAFAPCSKAVSLRYLGSGVVRVKSETGKFLFSPSYGKQAISGRPVGEFNSGYLLIENKRKYYYIGLNFGESFDLEYADAQPFQDGYAAVKLNRGWTIIDVNGFHKSLDSYGEIEVHGNGLFSTSKSALFGLFNSQGTEILPVEYERIKVMENNVIQAVKNGEIYYFKNDGTAIPY